MKTAENFFEREVNKMGMEVMQALCLLQELVDGVGGASAQGEMFMHRCRELIRQGTEAQRLLYHSVPFEEAVAANIEEHPERRQRTVQEIVSFSKRLMNQVGGLRERLVRSITSQDCRQMITQVFTTPRQQGKARIILHGIFAFCLKNGWCASNPVAALPSPRYAEAEIAPLPWMTLRRLLKIARKPEHRSCMPALGVMLWAGVRPTEMRRLTWECIDWEEGVITMPSVHSKTGGCRHITLQPVLAGWLREAGVREQGPICPPNWPRRWQRLREAAGAIPWQQDVLRHTFASYHVKQWHNFELLQMEMGHRSSSLLRTRYLSMKGITRIQAAHFWSDGIWQTVPRSRCKGRGEKGAGAERKILS